MAIKFLLDHHVPKAITVGLRLRDIDLLTAYEDNSHQLDNSQLLDRASELNRVLYLQDDDLIIEAVQRQKNKITFTGLVYSHPLRISIGSCIHDLEIIGGVGEPDDLRNNIEFLPLRSSGTSSN